MPVIFSPPFTIEEAIARGDDVYEVLFASWGIENAQFTNMQFPIPGQPGIPASLAGIAIGSKSTVDRCWVSYNPGKRRTPNDPLQQENLLRMLSVESPLIFNQKSAVNPNAKNTPGAVNDPVTTLSDTGALYIFPMADRPAGGVITFAFGRRQDTTVLPLNYTDVNGVVRTFGNFDEPPRFMTPFLHLLLYLKPPAISFIPTKRAPLQVQGTITLPIQTPGVERVVAQIPTFGRRAIKVMFVGPAASFRVGALRGISQLTGVREQPVDLSENVPADTPTVLAPCNECCHYADYTNLYATPTTDAGGQVTFQLTAYD